MAWAAGFFFSNDIHTNEKLTRLGDAMSDKCFRLVVAPLSLRSTILQLAWESYEWQNTADEFTS